MSTDEIEQVSTCGLVDTRQAGEASGRRWWPEAKKRQLVAETLAPGSSVSVVARRHDVNANQLFRWRREYLSGQPGGSDSRLLPVVVSGPERPALQPGMIEIELASGHRVRVCGRVDGYLLQQVLGQLTRR
jgi:transposase